MAWVRPVAARGPDLRLWHIGRRWSLWRPRIRRVRLDLDDGWNISSLFDDISAGLAVTVVIAIVALLASPLGSCSPSGCSSCC